MKFWLIAAMFLTSAAYADQSPDEAISEWRAANWTCESGKDHDGVDVDLKQVKEACVSMGVLTAKLAQAGYCYDAKAVEWSACK